MSPALKLDGRLPALGLPLAREEIDANHFFSPSRRRARPIPTVRSGATFMTSCPANSAGSYPILVSGLAISAVTSKRRLRNSGTPGVIDAAAAQHDARERTGLARRAQVGLRAFERRRDAFARLLDHRHHVDARAALAAYRRGRLGLAEVELALRALDERVAAHLEILGEVRHAALHDVDVGDLGPDVQDGDHVVGPEVVVGRQRVLRRERVHVHDQRLQAGLADQVAEGHHHVLLGRHQQHLHLLGIVRRRAEDLEVERHVVDVVRDVLLGFPVDRLLRVLRRELVHGDLLHDHGASADRRHDVARLDAARLEQVGHRVRHQLTVHDFPVHDRFGERRARCPS